MDRRVGSARTRAGNKSGFTGVRLSLSPVLAPIVLAVIGVGVVLRLAALLLRLVFAPVVWLNGQPQRQRVSLHHYDGLRR